MKKYLREIQMVGMVLMTIGVLIAIFTHSVYSGWLCGAGMVFLLVAFLYMAFHWSEYERENKQNIRILVLCIIVLLAQMIIGLAR